jgi:hypothetical protein
MNRVIGLTLSLLLCFFTIAGCASKSRAISSEQSPLSIHIKRLKSEDSWLVTYKLPKPVRKLVFNRQTSQFRRDHWKILSTNISLAMVDGEESLVSETDFDEVRVKIGSYYEMTPNDYEFFFKYSDGSLMMYTGHFLAKGYDVASYSFESTPGDRTVILGRVFGESVVRWDDTSGEGTYVYFGKIKPLENARLTAIVDPGLPRWLRDETLRMLPKLIDFYATKTGVPLDFKPVVFFNFEPDANHGWSQTGGTLPGLVHLSIKGEPKAKDSRERKLRLFEWLAHEMAHFWNGRMFKHDDSADWMHEGGADAFKHRALSALKLSTPARMMEAHNTALNDCAEGLQGISLDQSGLERRFKNQYDCGMILALITERAISKKGGLDLFEFWKRLFARATRDGSNHVYSEEMYFELLDKITGDSTASKRLSRLVHEKADDWPSVLKTTLNEAGLPVEFTETPVSQEAGRGFGRKALKEVMKADCGGRYGLTSGPGIYATEGFSECKAFTVPMGVDKIEGYDLFNAGHSAYDAVYRKCAAAGTIEVGVASPHQRTFKVSCTKPIEKRAPQLRIAVEWLSI